MDIWGFVIGGAIVLIIFIIIISIAVEICEDKIEELETKLNIRTCELEKMLSIYFENLKYDIRKLNEDKKDKTDEDIIKEELLKYSKECAKAVEDRLNKKGDGK